LGLAPCNRYFWREYVITQGLSPTNREGEYEIASHKSSKKMHSPKLNKIIISNKEVKRMFKKDFCLIAVIVLIAGLSGCGRDKIPPKVVSTFPQDGAMDVNPSLSEISVTFNEPMRDKCWSWCYEDREHFPEINDDAYYTDNYTKNVLPVKLEPNTEYIIWLNTVKIKNFMDKSGNPVEPYKFTFKTSE